MTDERARSSEREPWRLIAATVHPIQPSIEAADLGGSPSDAVYVELWERRQRAFFAARSATGALIREVSAGRGYLREHDHISRHQVIRESRELPRDLSIVRAAFGPTAQVAGPMEGSGEFDAQADARLDVTFTAEGRPDRLVVDGVGLKWTYAPSLASTARSPFISRPRDFTWELYASRGLPFLRRVLDTYIPEKLPTAEFETGFLYASSWYQRTQLHVVWRSKEGEIELVVADRFRAAESTTTATMTAASGYHRTAVLRATDPDLLAEAVAVVNLRGVAGNDLDMPIVEGPIGKYRIVGGIYSDE